jgi:hypothetical protein
MLYLCLYRRERGFCSYVWYLVDRNWKRVSFARKRANVACSVGRKRRGEAGFPNRRNTGILLYLLQQISVSR